MLKKDELMILIKEIDRKSKSIHKSARMEENYKQIRELNTELKTLLKWWDEYLFNISELNNLEITDKDTQDLFLEVDNAIKKYLEIQNDLLY